MVDPWLAEGLVVYVSQHMVFENQRAQIWEAKWSLIWLRAQLIMHTHLGSEESATAIPEMEVELDEEPEANEWDDQYEDEGDE